MRSIFHRHLPLLRPPGNGNHITFSIYYAYNERYILPFSHDEVVHGKETIIGKLYGSYEEKFAQARLLYLYMMTHPGKKLNFMGNELAMFREWNERREPDWEPFGGKTPKSTKRAVAASIPAFSGILYNC